MRKRSRARRRDLCKVKRGVEKTEERLLHDANDSRRSGADDGVTRGALVGCVETAGEFAANKRDERFHLLLHISHLVTHVENDFDAGEIHAEFTRERENNFEPLKILIGIEPSVALRARRLQKSNSLIETQGLRMQFVQFRDRTDHVTGFCFLTRSCCHVLSPLDAYTAAREKISWRGSSGAALANSRSSSLTFSSSGRGTITWTSTI